MTKVLTISISLNQEDIELLKEVCEEDIRGLDPKRSAKESIKYLMATKILDSIEWQFGEAAQLLNQLIEKHKR